MGLPPRCFPGPGAVDIARGPVVEPLMERSDRYAGKRVRKELRRDQREVSEDPVRRTVTFQRLRVPDHSSLAARVGLIGRSYSGLADRSVGALLHGTGSRRAAL